MYESPITKIVGDIQSQMIENEDDEMLVQVRQSIGYNVDKDELLKVLQYDRNQYEKGYKDGRPKWIPVSERLPEDGQEVLYSTKTGCVFHGEYYDDNTDRKWFSYKDDLFSFNNVVNAWMPLPEPYKEGENE